MSEKKISMAQIKQSIKHHVDNYQDSDAARMRAHFMDRWAEITNCPVLPNGRWDYSKIDYENKWVKLEWHLCDPRILFKLTDPKYRAEGIMRLPEECRETYYLTGPDNSKPYSEIDLSPMAMMKDIKKSHKIKKEQKKAQKQAEKEEKMKK